MHYTLRTLSFLVLSFVLSASFCYSQKDDHSAADPFADGSTSETTGDVDQTRPPRIRTKDQNCRTLIGMLNDVTSIEFFDAPLSDVAQELSDLHGVTFAMDRRALGELAIEDTEPITKTLSDVRLGTALSLILDDLELVLSARDNVFLITTREADPMITRVYETSGLVHASDSDWGHLVETLTTTVDPDTWEEL